MAIYEEDKGLLDSILYLRQSLIINDSEYKLNGEAHGVKTDPETHTSTRVGNVLIITPGQPGDVHLSRSVNILTSK
jgi:hypothetical protein